ncbi:MULTISPECIES: hypothetical protein [unclassified Myxococcus]|uniref:hypothetical protein n=1 Tax=unclassified Myxococcus TaxID=2648731 RepID=UPI00157BA5D3|nr:MULTISPECIES: hypothetical protein [unclassified Myxococcus]NTX01517.1 hypothetical protein [Myxococcus sp. CA040A]NTX41417.1 hypothetical protein [Myxococcus sp. CA033]
MSSAAAMFREVTTPWGHRSWRFKLARAARGYLHRPRLRIPSGATDVESATRRVLLYFMLPAWLVPGVVDWVWHKRTDIEHTSGAGESLIHCLMMTEVGVPVMMGLLMEINPLTLSVMLGHSLAHEATAFADVAYAINHQRDVEPREQHTHSFLEVLPFMAVSSIVCLHWDQFLAIWGIGGRKGRWRFALKKQRLPAGYLRNILLGIGATIVLPYANELWRCIRAQRRGEALPPWKVAPHEPVVIPEALAAHSPHAPSVIEAH